MPAEGVRITTERPADVDAFVLACWLKHYYPRGCVTNGLDPESSRDKKRYYQAHHPAFTQLLRTSTLALAVVDDEPDVYLGWALGKPGRLHYVFVKGAARGHGIGDALVRAACGDGDLVYSFEPGERDGRPKRSYLAVAQRRGYRFQPHRVTVHKRQEQTA